MIMKNLVFIWFKDILDWFGFLFILEWFMKLFVNCFCCSWGNGFWKGLFLELFVFILVVWENVVLILCVIVFKVIDWVVELGLFIDFIKVLLLVSMFILSELLLYWVVICSFVFFVILFCNVEFIVDIGRDDDGVGFKLIFLRWRLLDEVSGVVGVGVLFVLIGIWGGDDKELFIVGFLIDVKVVNDGLLGLDMLIVEEMVLVLSVEFVLFDRGIFDWRICCKFEVVFEILVVVLLLVRLLELGIIVGLLSLLGKLVFRFFINF